MTFDIKEAAEILGLTERRIRQMCDTGELAGAAKTGSTWQIPDTASPKLFAANNPEQIELSGIEEDKKEKALKKLGILKQLEQFAAAWQQNGSSRAEAIKVFCGQNNLKPRSLYRWQAEYRQEGLVGLVDERGGRVKE